MLAKWLERSGEIYGHKLAIALGEKGYMTYDELAERVARFANGLKGRGIKPGSRIAIFATNCPQYLEILFGCWHGGFVVVPINNKLHKKEMHDILEDSGADYVFTSGDLHQKWQLGDDQRYTYISVESEEYDLLFMASPIQAYSVAPDALAWLFYTSGTTGKPKGAMLSYRNLHAMCHGYFADVDHVFPGDSLIHAAPMSHGSGLYALPYVAMGGIHVIPETGRFDPHEIEKLSKFWKNATMFAAPTMVKRLVDAKIDSKGIKNIIYGGGPMYIEDALKACAIFSGKLTQIYGQGESPMTISVLPKWFIEDDKHPEWRKRLGSVGVANQVVEVAIKNADSQPVPPGTVGEICVKGDSVMLGYWRNEVATAQILKDGWLMTGDMGHMSVDGFITLQDRSKDVIISGGSNIYPREVEEVLLTSKDVEEVSVIARMDSEWGEVPIAYYCGEARPEDLDNMCLNNLARFKRPKEYIRLEKLPKNNYGKILKTELRLLDQNKDFS